MGRIKDLLFRYSIGKNESVRSASDLPPWTEADEQKVLDMFKSNPEFDNARKAATLALLGLLSQLITENPTMRFSQILQNYGFVEYTTDGPDDVPYWINEYYLEPVALLKRVQDRISDLKNSKG